MALTDVESQTLSALQIAGQSIRQLTLAIHQSESSSGCIPVCFSLFVNDSARWIIGDMTADWMQGNANRPKWINQDALKEDLQLFDSSMAVWRLQCKLFTFRGRFDFRLAQSNAPHWTTWRPRRSPSVRFFCSTAEIRPFFLHLLNLSSHHPNPGSRTLVFEPAEHHLFHNRKCALFFELITKLLISN